MEKQELVMEVINSLPEDFKTKYIVFKNIVMPFPKFLEEEFINYFPLNASLSYIVDVVISNFSNRIKDLDTLKTRKIEKFIEENVQDQYKDEFRVEARRRINDNLKFYIGEEEKDIDYFYQIFVNNHRVETFSKEDLKELLIRYIDAYLEEEYHDFILPEYGMSAKDFILGYVLDNINENGDLEIDLGFNVVDGNEIEQVVILISEYAREMYKLEQEKKIDEHNHTSENPSLVPEMKAVLNKENKLEVTHELPVIVPPLSQDEIASLTVEINEEELIYDLISDIREYLDYCNNQEMIKWVNIQLTALEDLVKSKENIENYKMYLVYAFNKLEEIKQNVIKVESNKGDYVDAIFGQMTLKKDSTDVIKVMDEIEKKDISDKQLKETLNKEKRENAKKNILMDFKKLNQERFFIEAEIEYRIIEIRRLKKNLEIENASNNYIAGTEIKYDLAIKEFEKYINEVDISEEDRTSYINIINSIINDNKNGIGRG